MLETTEPDPYLETFFNHPVWLPNHPKTNLLQTPLFDPWSKTTVFSDSDSPTYGRDPDFSLCENVNGPPAYSAVSEMSTILRNYSTGCEVAAKTTDASSSPCTSEVLESSAAMVRLDPCASLDLGYLLNPWPGKILEPSFPCVESSELRESFPSVLRQYPETTYTSESGLEEFATHKLLWWPQEDRQNISAFVNEDLSESQAPEPMSNPTKRPLELVKSSISDAQSFGAKPHPCQLCRRGFKYLKDLRRHNRSFHDGLLSAWFCPIEYCSRGERCFSRKDKFIQHAKTHVADPHEGHLEHILAFCYRSSKWGTSYQSYADMSKDESLFEEGITQGGNPPMSATSEYSTNRDSTPMSTNDSDNKETSIMGRRNAYTCTVLDCRGTFSRQSDLLRHERTKHMYRDAGEGYMCAAADCTKADKVWTRLDNFRAHAIRRHGNYKPELTIRKSGGDIRVVMSNFLSR